MFIRLDRLIHADPQSVETRCGVPRFPGTQRRVYAPRMVSNRNIKISASIVMPPSLIAVQAWSTIGWFWFPLSPAI